MNAKQRRMIQRMRAIAESHRQEPSELVYITRSFARKIQPVQYEPVDFFCSLNLQCRAEDAEAKSLQSVEWCKAQVQRDIAAYRESLGAPVPASKHPSAQANARAFEQHQKTVGSNGNGNGKRPDPKQIDWAETDKPWGADQESRG